MTSPQPLYDVFDTATKVNSPWALAAFAIAAVVAIIFLLLSWSGGRKEEPQPQALSPTVSDDTVSEDEASEMLRQTPVMVTARNETVAAERRLPIIPWLAWIVLIVAIIVPISAWAFVATHSDLPYLFRVVVYDKVRGLITNPHVVCGAPGCTEQGVIDSAAQFQLAPSQVPAGNSVTFYADSENDRGKQSVTLGKTRSVPVEVDIAPTLEPQPGPTTPPPNKPSQPNSSSSSKHPSDGSLVDAFWRGDYDSGWTQSESASGSSAQIASVVIVSERWEVSIEQANRVVMTFTRRPKTNSETSCHAIWRGTVTRGNPGVVNFQASRDNQGDFFCDVQLPVAVSGMIQRVGEQSFAVTSTFDPWRKVNLKLRKPAS